MDRAALTAELQKGERAALLSDALAAAAAVPSSVKDIAERDAALASRDALVKKCEDVAASINAQTVTRFIDCPASIVRDELYRRGEWQGVLAKANDARNGEDKSPEALVCQMLHELVETHGVVKMSDAMTAAAFQGDLNVLVTAGDISSADAAAVLAAMQETVPLYVTLGYGRELDFNDVLMATEGEHGTKWTDLAQPSFDGDPGDDRKAKKAAVQPVAEARGDG